MTIKELARRAATINIPDLKRKAVKNKEKRLVELQQKQIRQGMNAAGGFFKSYPAGYAAYKSTLSTYHAPIGVPDLFLKGNFARGIRMKLSGDDYLFDSTDSKNDKLDSKYRPFGLNSTTLPQAQVLVTNEFDQLAGKHLGMI